MKRLPVRPADEGRSTSRTVTPNPLTTPDDDAEFARLEAQQRHIQDKMTGFRATDRVARDEVHDRAIR